MAVKASSTRHPLYSFQSMIHRSSNIPQVYRFVDVSDVAHAHIQAFEAPSASGRYCLVGSVAHFIEVVKILKELYLSLNLPEKCQDDKHLMPIYEVSKEETKSLGMNFIPREVSLKDSVDSLKANGFVSV